MRHRHSLFPLAAAIVLAGACQSGGDTPDPAATNITTDEIGQAVGQSALLSGMHDIQSAGFMQGATSNPDKGWITDLQYIGTSGTPPSVNCHGSEIASGISIIQRLDADGSRSFPDAAGKTGYATAFGAYVGACPQIHVWIVGNEPNFTSHNSDPSSYVVDYAAAYIAAWLKVHAISGHEHDFVLMSPASPFSPWCLCSMHRIIQEITRQSATIDGFAVHAYTRATTFDTMVAAVTNEDLQADPPCNISFHKNFRIYQDWIAAINAEGQGGKPVFITEAGNVWDANGQFCPANGGCYPNSNINYFQALYQEIRGYNAAHATTKVRAVTLYRWADFQEPQSTPFAISTRPGLQPDITAAFAANLLSPLTCDNNVSVGNTACGADTSAEFICTNPGASSTDQWTRHACPSGQTCSGTSCSGGGGNCPYGSIQARVQLNISQPWTSAITISLGQSFILAAFHDSQPDFTSCCTTLALTGPGGFTLSPANDSTVTPPTVGTYQFTATCGTHTETATVTVTGGGGCTCSGGTTFWGSHIPPSDTSCGFQVCGNDNQRYTCQADGWHGAGNSPCNCRCTGGSDVQSRTINPDYTYCGYSVCGADHQHYTCTGGGWSAQHDSCN